MCLDASLPEVYRLVGRDMSNEELENHPLMLLIRWHGSRG
jgi:hypothetical protein